jgi:ribosomal protein S18 acetylase RimI-like enzyme
MMPVTIKVVAPSDANRVVNTIVQAFSVDPVARWFYPSREKYLRCFPVFVEAFAGAAIEYGSGDCVHDYLGAALWLPPGVHPDEEMLFALLQDTIPEEDQADVFALLQAMDRNHPVEPHWYLPMIGVDPAKQGNGYGSALLKHALRRCDGQHAVAYLESSSPKNVPLYERHGFELLGTIQVGSSPPLFPMLRRPRPSFGNRKNPDHAAADPSG